MDFSGQQGHYPHYRQPVLQEWCCLGLKPPVLASLLSSSVFRTNRKLGLLPKFHLALLPPSLLASHFILRSGGPSILWAGRLWPEERSWIPSRFVLDPPLILDLHRHHPNHPGPRGACPRRGPVRHCVFLCPKLHCDHSTRSSLPLLFSLRSLFVSRLL